MSLKLTPTDWKQLLSLPVIVAALGYFVDIYDLQLFGIVRVPSLKSLGLTGEDINTIGATIINWQMSGLLIGGILWGVLGDKKGRLSVLFGSIITYSLANIACGLVPKINFMDQVEAYKYLRFIAGVGLAGELGAGITLVTESLPQRLRALGTSLVAGVGLLGAVVATFTVKLSGDWTIAYFIGGGMGIALLLLRIGVMESGIFHNMIQSPNVERGNFLSFFTNRERFVKYIKCIGIGLPTWFCIGIIAYQANQFGTYFGIETPVEPGMAIMWAYIGISAGDFLSGIISQYLQSRKKAIAYMMAFSLIGVILFLFTKPTTVGMVYFYCTWLGLGTGFWAMFVTVGAEQFGTNLRATAATTIPNMVRGALILMNLLFGAIKPNGGVLVAALIVGTITYVIAFYCTLTIEETHHKDLDYYE
jgi:Major Facilitator Superfamily